MLGEDFFVVVEIFIRKFLIKTILYKFVKFKILVKIVYRTAFTSSLTASDSVKKNVDLKALTHNL